jgi:hypothetical protein
MVTLSRRYPYQTSSLVLEGFLGLVGGIVRSVYKHFRLICFRDEGNQKSSESLALATGITNGCA